MKNKLLNLSLLLLLALPGVSHAKAKLADQSFEGVVSKIDSKTVTVVYRGRLHQVLKKHIAQKKYTIGQYVDVIVPAREFASIKVSEPKPYQPKVKK